MANPTYLRILSVIAVFAAVALLVPALAFGQGKPKGKKIPLKSNQNKVRGEAMIGAGVNLCMDDGDAECDDVDPSYNIFASGGARFHKNFGVYLDVSFGALTVAGDDEAMTEDQDIQTLNVMLVPRGWFPLGKKAEAYAGAGFGFTQQSTESDLGEGTVSNFTDVKLNLGAIYRVSKVVAIGVNIDYIFLRNDAGEACFTPDGGSEECVDVGDEGAPGDRADLLQPSLIGQFRF